MSIDPRTLDILATAGRGLAAALGVGLLASLTLIAIAWLLTGAAHAELLDDKGPPPMDGGAAAAWPDANAVMAAREDAAGDAGSRVPTAPEPGAEPPTQATRAERTAPEAGRLAQTEIKSGAESAAALGTEPGADPDPRLAARERPRSEGSGAQSRTQPPARPRAEAGLVSRDGAGLILRTLDDGIEQPAPVLETEVAIQITGPTARAVVRQRFTNPAPVWAEGIYLFPLPEDAAVDHLRMLVGDRVIEGEIQEREAANRTYQQARQAGQRASLVAQQRPNVFTTSVANIPPGGEITVEIEYQQSPRWVDGDFRLRFPMVVGPRFNPPPAVSERMAIGAGGWGTIIREEPVESPIQFPDEPGGPDGSLGLINPIRLSAELIPGFELAALESPYHPIAVERDPQGRRFNIRLQAEQTFADRDFELVWRPAPGREPTAAFFTQRRGDQLYGLLMVTPPTGTPDAGPRPPREVTFVLDTSGSMDGGSIQQAREALAAALRRLTPADFFNLIEFDDQSRSLFGGSVSASAVNLRRALAHVAAIQSGGGTMIAPALQMALAESGRRPGALSQIIFLTDGSVGNEAEILQMIHAGLGQRRLFTVGIGSAPNSHFMRQAAQFGRGTFTYIGDLAEVRDKMGLLLNKLESPVLTDVRLELDVGADILPQPIGDLYQGEPVTAVMRLDAVPHEATLSGRLGAQSWRTTLELANGAEESGVAALWARRKIAHWMDARIRGVDQAAVRAAVLELALEHHLVSAYTSLVAVDRAPARPEEEALASQRMRTNLPHGWNPNAFRMGRTATPGPLSLAAGLLLMAIGWGWRRFGRGAP